MRSHSEVTCVIRPPGFAGRGDPERSRVISIFIFFFLVETFVIARL